MKSESSLPGVVGYTAHTLLPSCTAEDDMMLIDAGTHQS